MNNYIPLGRRMASYAIACSFITFTPFAVAQSGDDVDEVIELSPFTVDVSGDKGWRASTTLTGSRTNQELKNIPISVDALTTEFMEDLGIQTLEDAAFYIAGMDATRQDESRNDQDLSSFRGMVSGGRENSQSARNNFIWYSRSDMYNVERIDFNKGSNSLMFGDTSPGGQASVYTKRAQFRNFGSFHAQYGSFDSSRFMLDVNRKLTDKIALRLNMVDKSDKSYVDWGDDAMKGYHLANTIKATENTTFRLEFEHLEFERSRALSGLKVQQRAAEGRGLSSSSRQFITVDGDYYDGRTRLYYPSNGSGGFAEPYTIADADRRNGSGGDEISLYEGHTETVFDRDGDPLLTLGDIPAEVNAYGARSFQDREVYNYTFIAEHRMGDLNIEFAANLQEQYQFRNDSDFDDAINVAGDGSLYNFGDLDQKWFGNDANTVRLTASYPLQIGEDFSQFIVANATYLDDEAYSFRQRLVNKAKAWDPDTQTYDTAHDLEGRDRIRAHAEVTGSDPVPELRDASAWDSLRPENLPNVPGIFEPMWVNYTTSNKPYTDKRYSKSASISSNGTYLNGNLRSLVGVREDEFALKRYQLPGGSREERVAEFGEIAYWGQDVYVGSPDDAPDYYAYLPELMQSATTYNMGLVYSLTDTFNVYANQATSFRWQGSEDFLGRIIGAQEGKTNEIGFKSSFMDDTFTVTAALFEIDRENVAFRVSGDNSRSEVEILFNDQVFDIEEDGTIVYVEPDPAQPGYQPTGMGLNQEHRQITASETVKGWELNLMMRRTAGLQARLAISHNDIESSRDLTDYTAQVELARARVPVRQAFLDANWPNDPLYEEGTLPDAEEDLRESLEDAEDVLVDNAGVGNIVGSRARPYMASWILDYQFGENFVLPEMRVLLQGRYSDNYLMRIGDGMDWVDGSRHPVSLSFLYKKTIGEYPVDFRFRIRNLHDFENGDTKVRSGRVDDYSDLPVWDLRNEPPTSYEFSATLKF